jgi:hypothetical protein
MGGTDTGSAAGAQAAGKAGSTSGNGGTTAAGNGGASNAGNGGSAAAGTGGASNAGEGGSATAGTGGSTAAGGASAKTVSPEYLDEILVNPGIGFADFGFGWGNPPPLAQYPATSVAYFRWTWAELEPTEGAYAFDVVDQTIATAKTKGETLAFRIMTVYDTSSPQWLLDKGVASVVTTDGVFPDHNDPTFLDHHRKLVEAFGARYGGKQEIDHVDIGSVGCWGEWNTACCDATSMDACTQYFPTEANQKAIIDLYAERFAGTPLVALVGAPVAYAVSKGAGWRGDCYGDYGYFSPTWNHMVNVYEPIATDPLSMNAWQKAPVQFEACGVMQEWVDKGFDIDLILQKGLDWHLSVFNGKSSPVPDAWRPKIDGWLKKIGYRFVLGSLTHETTVAPGGSLSLGTRWQNIGVAPPYHRWPIAFRLRGAGDDVIAEGESAVDVRTWLPGEHEANDVLPIPAGITPGSYSLDVAVLAEDGSGPRVKLAIVGERVDGWYAVSDVTVK